MRMRIPDLMTEMIGVIKKGPISGKYGSIFHLFFFFFCCVCGKSNGGVAAGTLIYSGKRSVVCV